MKLIPVEHAHLRCEHVPRPGAPALLLLNSLGASLEMWDDQCEALSERYELIRYDKRGHGRSTLETNRESTMEQLARDALAVMDGCGIARAHLCGLSIGGMTAMTIAAQWPDRVLKVVLANTSPYLPSRENWQARIDAVLKSGIAPMVEGILARWFTPEFLAVQPERVDRVRSMLLAGNPLGHAACAAAIRDMDLRETIKTIAATTLVIGGTYDAGTTPAQAQLIAESIPGAKLVMLEAAHLSNIERADEFTRAVLEFLAA